MQTYMAQKAQNFFGPAGRWSDRRLLGMRLWWTWLATAVSRLIFGPRVGLLELTPRKWPMTPEAKEVSVT